LGVVVTNSYKLYQSVCLREGASPMTHMQFQAKVCHGLAYPSTYRHVNRKRQKQETAVTGNPKRAKKLTDTVALDMTTRSMSNHTPADVLTTQARCSVCAYVLHIADGQSTEQLSSMNLKVLPHMSKKSRSHWRCAECNINFCSPSCWRMWHCVDGE